MLSLTTKCTSKQRYENKREWEVADVLTKNHTSSNARRQVFPSEVLDFRIHSKCQNTGPYLLIVSFEIVKRLVVIQPLKNYANTTLLLLKGRAESSSFSRIINMRQSSSIFPGI